MRVLCLSVLLWGMPWGVLAATHTATPATFASQLAQMQAGDTLVLASGSYGDVRCQSQCRPGMTLLSQAGSRATFRSLVFEGSARHITIRNVLIDGQGQARETVWIGGGAGNITFEDVEVTGATAHGIHVPDSSSGDNAFVRVRVHHNGTRAHFDHGLYLSAPRSLVRNSRVYANKGYGIHLYNGGRPGTTGSRVEATVIEENGWGGGTTYGLLLSDGQGLQAINNRLRHNGTGDIQVMRAPGVVLRGNQTGDGAPIPDPGASGEEPPASGPPQDPGGGTGVLPPPVRLRVLGVAGD